MILDKSRHLVANSKGNVVSRKIAFLVQNFENQLVMKKSFTLLLLFSQFILFSQKTDYLHETAAQRADRMAWWQDARFGLFLHWGAYSVAAGEYNGQKNYGEWLMYEAKVPTLEYEKLAAQLNPVQFNAEAWVKVAKDAGMKYIVITSKHHDGFSMFDSKVSDYDIVDRTPFKRDPLRELADACKKAGIKLCFYHSIMDWHHPDAKGDRFPTYRENYLKPQLKELLTNYGDIGVLWFDGEWIDEWTEPQGKDLYNYVRSLQPNIIVNNRVGKGRNGMQGMNNADDSAGDFGTPEQEILSTQSGLPWESCMTMNDHWGFNREDTNFKSAAEIIWNLADIVAKGGNYLLNVGPTPEGTFPQQCIDNLKVTGEWTHRNAAAIYGTKTWDYWQEGENVRYAQGADKSVFAFVKGINQRNITLKKIKAAPGSTLAILGENVPAKWRQTSDGLVITLPENLNLNAQPVWVFKIQGQAAKITDTPAITVNDAPASGVLVFTGTIAATITATPGATIFYTLNGSEPTSKSRKYTSPLRCSNSATIKAIAQVDGKMSSESAVLTLAKAKIGTTLETRYSEKYAAAGALSLSDGLRGSLKFTDKKWLGFEGADFTAVLDLGKTRNIKTVSASFLKIIPSWIFLPTAVEIQTSNDGKTFKPCAQKNMPPATDNTPNEIQTITLPTPAKCRYIRIVAKNQGICPSWHPGSGAKAWLFVDEVWVE